VPRIQYRNILGDDLDESLEFSPFIVNLVYTGDQELIRNKKIFDVKISEYIFSTA
jgi:hypothetical protein